MSYYKLYQKTQIGRILNHPTVLPFQVAFHFHLGQDREAEHVHEKLPCTTMAVLKNIFKQYIFVTIDD